MNKGDFGTLLAGIVIVVVVIFVLGALFAYPVMWLWNGVLVHAVTIANPITFWQAWGLMILSGILFKSSSYTGKSG